nr:hypothetical protein [Tanacetum cinerariifolium]
MLGLKDFLSVVDFTAASKDISVARHKLMLLDTAAGYGWSTLLKKTAFLPIKTYFMAFSSSSSFFDNGVPSCSKACSKAYAQLNSQYDKLTNDLQKSQFDVMSYQVGLESVEARLLVYKQNEFVLEENIKLLNIEVQVRDATLTILRQKLDITEKERDDLKPKLENFQFSSKNLTDLITSQTNSTHGLCYVSLEDDSATDRLRPSGGYHVVPLPNTGTFMPPKPDLVFHTPPSDENEHLAFNPIEAPIHAATPKPTTPKTNRSGKRKNRKTCFMCRSMDHLIKDCNFHVKPKPQPTPRNYAYKGHTKQNASFPQKHLQMHMVPGVVFTQSKPVYVTAVRPVSAVVPKIMKSRPKYAHTLATLSKSAIRRHKTHSHFKKTSNSSSRVTAVKAQRFTAAKGKQGKWIWKPKCPTLDHDFRTTGASLTLERLYCIDAHGRPKSVMAWIPNRF